MKKLFAKISLFILINVMLSTLILGAAAAEGEATPAPKGEAENILELGKALDKLENEEDACLNMEGADKNFIIAIREEPLSLRNDESNADYKTRICYRQSFSYWVKDQKYTKTELTKKECSEELETLANNHRNDYKTQYTCRPVQVILSKGGTTMIEGFISEIYTFAVSIVGIIAVAVIIISGIQISLAGGDQEGLNKSKDRIIKSLVGLAILFLSGLILYTVNPTFFVR